MRAFACLLAVALWVPGLGCPSLALAHGRPPFLGDIAFHPTDPNTIVVRATFGLVISEDGGSTWRWICAAVTGADPTREDPPILVTPDGSVLLGTFAGLARSTPDRCEFEHPEALADRFVIDLDASPNDAGTVWAVVTSGSEPDELFRSTDQGHTFLPIGAPIDDLLIERVRVAPSDPDRVYLSGAIPSMVVRVDGGVPDGGFPITERRGFFLRSDDQGATFTQIEIPLEGEERNVHLLAVDPTDPARVLVRMTRQVIDDLPERVLLTEDAGDTWATVTQGRTISGGVFSADGASAWVTSRIVDGLFRSLDGGRTFTQLERMSLPCVGIQGDEPWVCVDELTDDFALGRVTDGARIEQTLQFAGIYDPVSCPSCTTVGHVCPMWFPDIAYDLRLDAGSIIDGGVSGAPRDAGALPSCTGMDAGPGGGADAGPSTPPDGCGCRAVAPGKGAPWALMLVLALTFRRRPG